MEALENRPRILQNWRLITTPPLSGEENMRYDAGLLESIEAGHESAAVRLFRFKDPTVSYGRLQKPADIAALIPAGWAVVRRPTGGGVVFHDGDLCVSLIWARGQRPLPAKPQEVYQWIHEVIRQALDERIHMASCADACRQDEPYAIRQCFTNPVGYDLLNGTEKVAGGALLCRKNSFLYQGSIQNIPAPGLSDRLHAAFKRSLNLLND